MQLTPDTFLQSGKYRIIRVLGQGGFGITYEAEQVSLSRIVAVKEFFMKDCCERDAATSYVSITMQSNREVVEEFRGTFIREARMFAKFNCPTIVRVTDLFEENGTSYYVMDFLSGGSLADKVRMDIYESSPNGAPPEYFCISFFALMESQQSFIGKQHG